MTNSTRTIPSIELNDGHSIPQLGLGVWQIPDEEVVDVVETAVDAGYRHIDTATIYRNERGVGAGMVRSGLTREQIYLTTKLWNSDQGSVSSVTAAIDLSCELLGTDFVNLYLIHWATPAKDAYVATWEAMSTVRESGRARSIGVSNFHALHLERAIAASGVVPAVNQVELHPYFQQRELRALHAELGIATEAWSPLGQGADLLEDPVLASIATAHGCTAAQVVIAWHLAIGTIVIPKSANAGRIAQNYNSLDIDLTAEDIAAIDGLDRADGRIGPDPDEANFS